MGLLEETLKGQSLADYTNNNLRIALNTALYTNTADMWSRYLQQQGYTGSVANMMAKWWEDYSVPVAFRNYINSGLAIPAHIINDDGQLAPYVTFTRASTATRYNSAGLLETVAANAPRYDYDPSTVTRANLLRYSQEFDNAVWGKSNTSITANTIAAPDGTMTADTLTATSALSYISQIVGTAATFTLSVWIKRKTGTGNVSLVIRPGDKESVVAVTNDWVRYTYTAASAYSNVGVRLATSGDEVYIWGAQLEVGPTATAYIPTTASPAGNATLRGLLIEEQRTNALARSQEFNDAVWGKTDLTVTANAAVAPDGTLSADMLVENTTNSIHQALQSYTSPSIQSVSFSCYLKAAGRTKVMFGGNWMFSSVVVDLETGLVTGPAAAYVKTVPVGNGWWRVIFTDAVPDTTSRTYVIRLYNGTTDTYTGDGTSGIYIWGAQLEAGAFATSYIPTTTAVVTRAVDNATVNTLSSIGFNASEGSLFIEADTLNTANVPTFVGYNTGSTSSFFYGNGSNIATWNGASALSTTTGGLVVNTLFKSAMAYSSAGRVIGINNGALATDSNLIGTVNAIALGKPAIGATQVMNGHIRRLRYYPRRLSNAQLQRLTT